MKEDFVLLVSLSNVAATHRHPCRLADSLHLCRPPGSTRSPCGDRWFPTPPLYLQTLSRSLLANHCYDLIQPYAPEVILGHPRDILVDIWSLGCLVSSVWSVHFG
jgi:hypothetical protein